MKYLIPVSALPEDLQAKYYRQKRTETGIMPEKIKPENSSETVFKYRLKGVSKAFEEFSKTKRAMIKFWIDLLNEWQTERAKHKNKTEFDKVFIAHQKYIHLEIKIGTDILYRKYAAMQNECYGDLIDKRGGWNKYKSKLPFAVLEYSHNGEKAMHDHCIPFAKRNKSNVYANDGWVMDNYTIDVIIKDDKNSGKTRRLYITTVLDVKSNVLVGWNITESPDSNSTLDVLRFAMLRFGIPKRLYFDNGKEFTTLDIAGEQRKRKIAKDKKGNIPLTIVEKLGVELIFAEVKNAQSKVVERIHRIIKEQYCTAQYGLRRKYC